MGRSVRKDKKYAMIVNAFEICDARLSGWECHFSDIIADNDPVLSFCPTNGTRQTRWTYRCKRSFCRKAAARMRLPKKMTRTGPASNTEGELINDNG